MDCALDCFPGTRHGRKDTKGYPIASSSTPFVSFASNADSPLIAQAVPTYMATGVADPISLYSHSAMIGASEPATIEVSW